MYQLPTDEQILRRVPVLGGKVEGGIVTMQVETLCYLIRDAYRAGADSGVMKTVYKEPWNGKRS